MQENDANGAKSSKVEERAEPDCVLFTPQTSPRNQLNLLPFERSFRFPAT